MHAFEVLGGRGRLAAMDRPRQTSRRLAPQRRFLTAFALAILPPRAAAAAEVVELTAESFDSSVRNGSAGPWFVEFYAPWCGHCQRLAPTWAELAGRLEGEVTVAKVDATAETALAERFAVEGYPTLILLAEGSGYVYDGARSLEALEAYARGGYSASSESGPEPEEAEDEANSAAIKLTQQTLDSSVRAPGSEPWFVNFYIPSCGHCKSLAPTWEELALELKGRVKVAKVNAQRERPLAERWGVERFPTMRLVVGQEVFDYSGEREVAALRAFALGGYSSEPALPLPVPLAPLPLTLWEELLDRQHMIVAFLGGIAFAGLVSLAWVRIFAQSAERGDADAKAPATDKKEQ